MEKLDSAVRVESSGGAAIKPIVSFWQVNWSDQDLAAVRANRGEASGQAVPHLVRKELAGAVHAARKPVPGFLLENLIEEAKTTVE